MSRTEVPELTLEQMKARLKQYFSTHELASNKKVTTPPHAGVGIMFGSKQGAEQELKKDAGW